MKFILYIGPLRLILALLTVILIAMAPFAGEASSLAGWDAVVGTVAPPLAGIMLWVIPLDIMMNRIFLADTEDAERHRRIFRLDLFLFIALLLAWSPFIIDLVRQS